MNNDSDKLHLELIKHFGKTRITVKAIEEMAELTQALSKHLNGYEHNIEEEVGDVIIRVEQLLLMFDKPTIEQYKKKKLAKLKRKLTESGRSKTQKVQKVQRQKQKKVRKG